MIDICPFDHNRPVGFPTGSSERDFACIYPQMFLIRNIPSHFCDEAIERDVKKALPDTVHFNVRQNDSPDSEKWVVGVRGSSSSHMKSQQRIKICGVKFEVRQYFVKKCNIVPLEPVHLDKNDLGASPKQDFDRAFLTSEVSSRIRCFTRLKVLTWNTLFNRYNGQHGIELHSTIRYEAILQVLKEENAGVVALQEVEKEFWDVLAGDSWIRSRYTLSSMWCEWASCLLLCSNELDLQNSCAHELPGSSKSFCSPMVAVQLRLACHSCSQPFSFIVCTTHLLAYNTGVRQYQKLNLHQKFQPDKYHWNDCILMGDFNEQWTVPDDMEMTDVWHELHGSLDPGWTMDNKRNMLAEVTEQKVEYNGRIDLILYRSKRFHAVESHLIGTTPVSTILSKESESSEIPNYLFPSDHFGVVAVFETISK